MTTFKQLLLLAITAAAAANPLSSDADVDGLTKRGSACDQGDCPDFNAPFDLLYQRFVTPTPGGTVTTNAYYGRVNDCGKCDKIITNSNGCYDFKGCGRDQTICVDKGKSRAHRIWKDSNHKTCYHIATKYYGNCGVGLTNSAVYYSNGEIPCTW